MIHSLSVLYVSTFQALQHVTSLLSFTLVLCAFVTQVHSQTYIPPDHLAQDPSASIAFFPNQGQVANTNGDEEGSVQFESYGNKLKLYLREGNVLSWVLPAIDQDTATLDTLYRIDMKMIGELVNPNTFPEQARAVNYHMNYYLPHCTQGITQVPGYKRIIYPQVYPDIDMHIYSNAYGYKMYFVIHPGGDPSNILLDFDGQDSMQVDVTGVLRVFLREKEYRFPHGFAYQDVGGTTVPVAWALDYKEVIADQQISFSLGSFDPDIPLILDISQSFGPPQGPAPSSFPEWGTYYGSGSYDRCADICALPNGGMAATGETSDVLFPSGLGSVTFSGSSAIYVTEFRVDYSRRYTTFFSGDNDESFPKITAFNTGVAITGWTESTPSSISQAGPSGSFQDYQSAYPRNTFIAAFNQLGALEWSTLFGCSAQLGSTRNMPVAIASDADNNLVVGGNAFLFGATDPSNTVQNVFPVSYTNQPTVNSYPIYGGGYQQDYIAFRYWQFQGNGTASDNWIAKFNSDYQLTWSTLFGGSFHDKDGLGMKDLDIINGTVYVVGSTLCPQGSNAYCSPPAQGEAGFPWCPATSGYFQPALPPSSDLSGSQGNHIGYVAEFNTDNELVWCTAFGDPDMNGITDITSVSATSSQLYITGWTLDDQYDANPCGPPSTDFPICNLSKQFNHPINAAQPYDKGFIAEFRRATQLLTWSTTIGENTPTSIDAKNVANGEVFVAGDQIQGIAGGTYGTPLNAQVDMYGDVAPGSQANAFILGFDADDLFYGSLYGGNDSEENIFVALSPVSDRVYVGGTTRSTQNFPIYDPDPSSPIEWFVPAKTGLADAYYGQIRFDLLQVGVHDDAPSTEPSAYMLYPNPGTGSFTLQCNASACPTVSELEVFDQLGRLVFTRSVTWHEGQLDIELVELSAGSYHLRLLNSVGQGIENLLFQIHK